MIDMPMIILIVGIFLWENIFIYIVACDTMFSLILICSSCNNDNIILTRYVKTHIITYKRIYAFFLFSTVVRIYVMVWF